MRPSAAVPSDVLAVISNVALGEGLLIPTCPNEKALDSNKISKLVFSSY
ncbi:hypothetical protein [Chryseobacterium nematophagum]|nr:hypothetical protein [Chryseobacterium nematophagum]